MRRLLLAGLVLLAGCGGGDGKASTPPTTHVDVASSNEPIAVAVKAAATKLPLRDIVLSSAADDPNGLLGQPRQYVARVAWRDERVRPTPTKGEVMGVETGGSMERFAVQADLNERKQSLDATLGLLISSEVVFIHGLVLVRLPGTLTQQQAAEVDAALAESLAVTMPTTTVVSAPPTTRPRGSRPPRTTTSR